MKHPKFASMGKDYPEHLEAQYGRILLRIEELWDAPQIHDYFSDLLIDKRGGRQGFPKDVLQDIIMLREYHELATFRAAERKEDAVQKLEALNIPLSHESFLKAFREGNQEQVDLFVRAQFRLPIVDGDDPLVLAALKRGHTVVAKIIIEAGADVNLRNKLGLTPLLMACGKVSFGYRVIAEALISRGANVNVRDVIGNTPLILAISGGMFDIAHLLIERGAKVSIPSQKGETPLELALRSRAPEAAELANLILERLVDE